MAFIDLSEYCSIPQRLIGCLNSVNGGLADSHQLLAKVVAGKQANKCSRSVLKAGSNRFFPHHFVRFDERYHVAMKVLSIACVIAHDKSLHANTFSNNFEVRGAAGGLVAL